MTLSGHFLGQRGSRCFIAEFAPSSHVALGTVVFLPPFGEEMNRCRALVAAQARAFAESGYRSVLLDFYGTGDSEGELADASLSAWREDIHRTISYVTERYGSNVSLWGLRTGALLAVDAAASGTHEIQNILLWAPVTSGKRYVTQLLRQRVASLANSGQAPETTSEIRQRLQSGEQVEIAGYIIEEQILADFDTLSMASLRLPQKTRVFWMEHVGSDEDSPSTAAQKAIDALGKTTPIELVTFCGPAVWQLHKRDTADQLLQKTRETIARHWL